MIPIPDPERSMRVINSIGSGAALAALSGVIYSIVRCRGIGHRLLLWIIFAACLIRSVANLIGAWEVYFHGTLHWDVWVFFVTAVSSCGMVGMVLAARNDIVTTLRTSEAQERIRMDRAADLQMAQWNLEYLSQTTQLKSLELLKSQHSCHPPATSV